MRKMLCWGGWCGPQGWCLLGRTRGLCDLSLFGLISPRNSCALLCQNEVGPRFRLSGVFAYNFGKNLHPAILLSGAISIEVDGFSVGKSDAKAFLNKHVPLFFFSKCRLSPTFALGRDIVAHESRLIINQLAGFSEVDGGSGLARYFMVSGELGAVKGEETSPPVLASVQLCSNILVNDRDLLGNRHLVD